MHSATDASLMHIQKNNKNAISPFFPHLTLFRWEPEVVPAHLFLNKLALIFANVTPPELFNHCGQNRSQ